MAAITTLADDLCDHLNNNVLDEEISLLSLLDALACCGLTLAPDFKGEASMAYIDLIKRTFKV